MNRPEYSLTLDSVICPRCNTLSRADEDTCPQCGADRQGAIFTSHADTPPPPPPLRAASAAAAPMQEEAFDFVDLRDTGWLTRMARRKMVTSYPSLAEPGDEPLEPVHKPARKGLAVLIGGVVAGLAAGGYLYTQSGPGIGVAPQTDRTAISVAGAIRDKSSTTNDADATRHDTLTRDRVESAKAASQVNVATAESAKSAQAKSSHVDSAAKPVVANVPVSKPEPRVAVPAATIAATTPAPVVTREATPKAIASVTPAAKPAPQQTIAATPGANANVTSVARDATSAAKPVQQQAIAATSNANVTSAARDATPAAKPTPQQTIAATKNANVTSVARDATPTKKPQPTIEPVQAAANKQQPEQSRTHTLAAAPRVVETKPVATASQPASAKDDRRARTTLASIEKPAPVAAKTPEAPEPSSPTIARSIAAVQQSLASRDLSGARRNMRPLRASESRSPEIQQLAADLSRQERARDAAITNARVCALNKDPSCAVRNARRAVALDSRNPQTQAALRQAVAVQTEVNTAYFRQASAIPSPAVPALTFDGRWSATHPHASVSSDDNDRPNYSPFGWGAPGASRGRGDAH